MTTITAYHGTFIEPEDVEDLENPLFTPDGSCNDYGAYWVSNEFEDVKFFADQYSSPGEDAIKFIIKGTVDTKRHIEAENDGRIEIDGCEMHVLDRDEVFEAARRAGYTGINTPGNYPEGGDDIALLVDGEFNVEEFSFLVDGEWTEFMSWEAAEDLVRERLGSFAPAHP